MKDGHLKTSYKRNAEYGTWERPDGKRIAYSDGSDVEERILRVVCAARDRSVLSDELAAAISDWPTEYHFSRARHGLLRPLNIQPGDRVLELGCGCGALTRYLGECGAQVDAVEGSPTRARIAAARCHDLPRVAVHLDDLAHYSSDTPYDWVLLIGVLEYAPVYSDAPDPVGHYLAYASTFLAPEGRLVLAIENKLGLKYFNGCSEDHLGRPYYGVQGLYTERQPVTFGKEELAARLASAGLASQRFLYPFPDYKLPEVLLSEEALAAPSFDAPAWLPWTSSRDYTSPTPRAFSEPLVWRELAANGLLADLANSFLVVAAKSPHLLPPDEGTWAWRFHTQGLPALATQTRGVNTADGLTVETTRLAAPDQVVTLRVNRFTLTHRVGPTPLPVSSPWVLEFLRAYARQESLADCMETLRPWAEFLCREATTAAREKDGEPPVPLHRLLLAGDHLDNTPFHGSRSAGAFVPTPSAWRSQDPIPLGWVLVRSLQALLERLPGPDSEQGPAVLCGLLRDLFQRAAIPVEIEESDVAEGFLLEQEFRRLTQ